MERGVPINAYQEIIISSSVHWTSSDSCWRYWIKAWKTLRTVEVMDIDTKEWSSAADLPKPLYRSLNNNLSQSYLHHRRMEWQWTYLSQYTRVL